MNIPSSLGGWDVHAHIIPPAVTAAGERGLYGMRTEPTTLHICAHGVPLHPLSKIDELVERVKSDGLDGAVVSVPPPLFRPDLTTSERGSYTQLVNDSLLSACFAHQSLLRPFAYLPIEDPELAANVASRLDENWAGAVAGTDLGVLSYASGRYDALWQALSDAKLPLFIHPGAILIQSENVGWREKSLKGIHEKMLWRNEETGASIALIKFDKGAGIPQPHLHAANQFMFCLKGKYEYTSTGVVLTPGCFYCNPKGNVHGPAIAHEETIVMEMYDGPHYPQKPSWYTDEQDAH